MERRHFQKVVLRMKLFLSLQSFNCHTENIRVSEYVFTRDVIKIKTFHSCCTRAALVLLVQHSYYSSLTRVASVALVLHMCCSCRTRVARCLALVLYIRLDLTLISSVQLFAICFSMKKLNFVVHFLNAFLAWNRDISKRQFLE